MNLNKAMILAALATLAISTGAQAQAQSQDPQQTPLAAAKPESFQDWQMFCPEPTGSVKTRVCEIRTVATGKDGRKLGAFAVAAITEIETKKSEIIASALVPLGVDLREDPALKIDEGQPMGLKYVRCLQRGCEAMTPLSADQQASMQSGTKARVAVGVGGTEKAVLEFSLKGFTAALTALKQRTGAK
jgi:invasion protein IalB